MVCGRPSQISVRLNGYNQVTGNREVQNQLPEQPGEPSGKGV